MSKDLSRGVPLRVGGAAWQRDSGGLAALFVRATDLGLLCALFAVPFCMGGRQPLGQLVLTVSTCWAAFAWGIHLSLSPRTSWVWTRAEPLLLAAIGLAVLQTVRLPVEIVNRLSPQIAELLPLWSGGAETATSLGMWTQLSLSPAESRLGLVTFVAYALLFVVTAQRLRRAEDVDRLLKWICVAAASMAAFGLVQYVTSNGKFFWVYEHPYTTTSQDPKGSFTNRNHFAHFLALGIGPLIWWIMRAIGGTRRQSEARFAAEGPFSNRRELAIGVLSVALGIVVFAGLLSLSRGGAVAMFVATLVCVGILFRSRLVSGRLLAGLAGTGALLCAFLFICGYESVSKRLEDWDLSERQAIWEANLRVISDFPVFGTGIGSHVEAYQSYLDLPMYQKEFTHAENGYLQVASETGLVGLALAVLVIGTCFFWCLQGVRRASDRNVAAAFAAVTAGLAANVAHSMGDFVWYVPGCMVVVCMLAASACRLYQIQRAGPQEPSRPSESDRGPAPVALGPRFAKWASLGGVTCLAVWMIGTQWPAVTAESRWQQYLSLACSENGSQTEEGLDDELLGRKMSALTAASTANPDDARIQLRTAQGYLAYFEMKQQDSENRMSLAQIRDAAISLKPRFQSTEDFHNWLDRALGKNRKYLDAALQHSRRALRLCPLQGRGYLCLAELDFLGGEGRGMRAEYVNQAQRVRPYDPQVMIAAGREAFAAGDLKLAVEHWRRAFPRNVTCQRLIIDRLAPVPQVKAQDFVRLFEPDGKALGLLALRYKELNRNDDYRFALAGYAEKTVAHAKALDNREAIRSWLNAQLAFDALGREDRALECLQAALTVDPHSFNVRSVLAMWFFKRQRFTEAAEHLAWCSRQRPGDRGLQRLAKKAAEQSNRISGLPPEFSSRPRGN